MSYSKKIEDSINRWRKSKDDDALDMFMIDECDLVNYKDPTFTVAMGITCTFKCDRENGTQLCQNYPLTKELVIHYSISKTIGRYKRQSFAKSLTLQGLEPLDNMTQLIWLLIKFREETNDKIIIWTGYTEEECSSFIALLNELDIHNVIIKFGRFRPNQESHMDELLGVKLVNPEQYAKEF